jgi:hypothetical protein
MKNQLQDRLRYLWTFELANGLVIFPLFYYVVGLRYRLGWFSLASMIVVCAILIVGAAFWFLKGRALSHSRPVSQPGTRRFFSAAKLVFGVSLLAPLALFVVRAFLQGNASRAELVLGGVLLILALLEYVNYYFVQLMYDNSADMQYLRTHRRLKRAVMVRDLGI